VAKSMYKPKEYLKEYLFVNPIGRPYEDD